MSSGQAEQGAQAAERSLGESQGTAVEFRKALRLGTPARERVRSRTPARRLVACVACCVATTGGVLALWGGLGAFTTHHAVQINEPQRMLTERFVSQRRARVLDLGAGSGLASIALLLARPDTTVAAVDRYEGYFGIDDNTPDRLKANTARAGVSDRLTVPVADMRQLPFDDRSFDAAMNIAALDHLDWPGISQTLREVSRVLVPGGQLLIGGLNPDVGVRLAIPSSMHGGYWGTAQNLQRWRDELRDAGFTVDESGTQPATVFRLAHTGQGLGTESGTRD